MSKRELRKIREEKLGPSPEKSKVSGDGGGKRDEESDAYTPQDFRDLLNAYFLSTWLQDRTYKDCIVSHIIHSTNQHSNISISTRTPPFLKALTPNLLNLILTDSTTTGLRRLIYAALARWGDEEDWLRLVPVEGDSVERGFVRGFWGFVVGGLRAGGPRANKHVKDDAEDEEDEDREDGNGGDERDARSAASKPIPPPPNPDELLRPQPRGPRPMPNPFGAEDLWSPSSSKSHVSWPATANPSAAASQITLTANTNPDIPLTIGSWDENPSREKRRRRRRSARMERENGGGFVAWPEREDEYCAFHEHGRIGERCHRVRRRWDKGERRVWFDG